MQRDDPHTLPVANRADSATPLVKDSPPKKLLPCGGESTTQVKTSNDGARVSLASTSVRVCVYVHVCVCVCLCGWGDFSMACVTRSGGNHRTDLL